MSDDQEMRDRKAAECYAQKTFAESPGVMRAWVSEVFLAGLEHARANPPAEVLALVEAAENLENDDGSIPDHAWKPLINAIAAYRAATKQKDEEEFGDCDACGQHVGDHWDGLCKSCYDMRNKIWDLCSLTNSEEELKND